MNTLWNYIFDILHDIFIYYDGIIRFQYVLNNHIVTVGVASVIIAVIWVSCLIMLLKKVYSK